MKLTFVEKMKIGKMLREKSFSDINYYSFYDVSNKKSKYNDVDILEYLLDYVYEAFSKNEVINLNYLLKYIYSTKMILANIINYEQTELITESYKNKLSALKVKYNEIRENYPKELNSKIDSEIDQINTLLEGIKLEINEEDAIKALDKETNEEKQNKEI